MLSEGARRFLKPLTGVDPADVPIYQGAHSQRFAAELSADAVTVPGAVALGSAYEGETPTGLGLLAHELTHIARQQDPRFVPPAVRRSRQAPGFAPDEETTAMLVEARAIDLARTSPPGRVAPPREPVATPPPLHVEASARPEPPAHPDFVVEEWAGLPAPWEPLPGGLELPRGSASAPLTAIAEHAVAAPAPHSSSSSMTAAAPVTLAAPAAAVQRADSARVLTEEAASPATPSPSQEEQKSPPPDIDALARQVYTVLKRRLEAEVRRERV
jgi:hypothetical protein